MMGRLQHFILFVSALLMVFASADECVDSVIVFGDSQLDSGNNALVKNCKLQANFPPYGSTFFKKPTGRFTNGRTVADFIAQYLGIEFQRPYQEVYQELTNGSLQKIPASGINFASAGSGVLPHTNKHDGVTPLETQLQQFQSLIDENHLEKQQIDISLFFLESGSNDIVNYFFLPGTPNMPSNDYVESMLKEVDLFIDTIYKVGARKIVIFSVGPMGCVPFRSAIKGAPIDQCFEKLNDMAKDYNARLELRVNNISTKYPDAVGVYGITYDTVQNFRDEPEPHGFTNVNEACCGGGPLNGMLQCGLKGYQMCSEPNEFFFWDFIHPTERVYELLSKELWSGDEDKIRPINLQTLACNNTSALF